MFHVRTGFAALLAATLLAAGGCATDEVTPVITPKAAPPAAVAFPADWQERPVQVPAEAGAATYAAPKNPQRLRAALILSEAGPAGTAAARELAIMLASTGVASLRFDGAPSTALDYRAALDRAGQALTALAQTSGLGDDRLLAMGHGVSAQLTLALGAGRTGRAPVPVGLIEPVLVDGPAGSPDPLGVGMALPGQKHNILTCSDADIAVDCTAVQSLADVMTGTHVNYVRLRGVSHSLQEDASRDPAKYGSELPFSADLQRSLGSWIAMQ